MTSAPIRVLAVASGGGHWNQLMLLRPAWDSFDVSYVTSDLAFAERDGIAGAIRVPDASRSHPLAVLRCAMHAFRVVRRLRPNVVVTTGALPGLMCLIAARALGGRTLWVDSAANAERLSGSGRLARRFATRVMTQWEHLATDGVVFAGRAL